MDKSTLTDWFLTDFWPLYLELVKTPYKTQFKQGQRGEALKAIMKLKPSQNMRERMISHLAAQIAHRKELYNQCGSRSVYEKRTNRVKFYCNRHGVTWINQMGWFDEIPEIEHREPPKPKPIPQPVERNKEAARQWRSDIKHILRR